MENKSVTTKSVAVLLVISTFFASSCVAAPGPGGGGPGGHGGGHKDHRSGPPRGGRRTVIDGTTYWIAAGLYYVLSGGDYVKVDPPIIRHLPPRHRVVIVDNTTYYVSGSTYYKTTPGGYVIVDEPANVVIVKSQPQTTTKIVTAPSSSVTLYVPKLDSTGYQQVTLEKYNAGYLGPQGEYYPVMPTIDTLSQIYGIDESLRSVMINGLFIHVPKKDGTGFVRVTLKKQDGGYLGPQGEFYPMMPTVAQLTEMYGYKDTTVTTDTSEEITVIISKKNSSEQIQVILTKQGTGYVGPQGEYYPEMPDASQLEALYGN